MTIMKLIRGIPPELYAELLANDGVCQCGCGRKVDMGAFEVTPESLAAEGAPQEVIDLIKMLQGQTPAPEPAPAPVNVTNINITGIDPEFEREKFAELRAKFGGGGGGDKVEVDDLFSTGKPAITDQVTGETTRGNYMHLFTGGKYYPLAPWAEDVDIRDIGHSLATKARYAGHTAYPFWVAQHSVFVAIFDVPGFNRPIHRLARLLHDGSETYNGDLIRPLKYSPEFRKPFTVVEERNEAAISKRFGLPFPFEAHVKIADEAVTTAECRQLLIKRSDIEFDEYLQDTTNVAPFTFREWDWRTAESRFIGLFNKLVADTYINAPDSFFDSAAYRAELAQFIK